MQARRPGTPRGRPVTRRPPRAWHHCPAMTSTPDGTATAGPRLSGTWYILPTPFDVDGAVDHPSLARLVDAAIGWGADGLTAMGVMAEPASLTDDGAIRSARHDRRRGRGPGARRRRLLRRLRPSARSGAGDQARRARRGRGDGRAAACSWNVDLLPGFYAAVAGRRPAAHRPGRARRDRGRRAGQRPAGLPRRGRCPDGQARGPADPAEDRRAPGGRSEASRSSAGSAERQRCGSSSVAPAER